MTSIFSQAHLIPVASTQEDVAYLTLDDIIPNIVPDDGDQHTAPTRVIAIENTFMGRIIPVDEVKRISQYARERKIKVHLDGARLWNACYPPETLTKSPEEASMAAKQLLRAYCSNVDTVTLCFSKSLGAPGGSILLSHSQDIITRARHFRKALGGGVRQMGFLSAPALVALNEHFLDGATLRRDNERAKLLEEFWTQDLGGQTLWGLGQETNMVWLDLRSANVSGEEFVKIAKEEEREWEGGIIKVADGRVVLHHRKDYFTTHSFIFIFFIVSYIYHASLSSPPLISSLPSHIPPPTQPFIHSINNHHSKTPTQKSTTPPSNIAYIRDTEISPSALEALKRVLRRTIEFGKLRIQAPPGVERRRRVDRTSRREGGGVGGRENGAEGRGRGGGGKEGERGEGEREKGEENEDEKAEKAEEFESLKKAVEKERQRREDRYDDLGF